MTLQKLKPARESHEMDTTISLADWNLLGKYKTSLRHSVPILAQRGSWEPYKRSDEPLTNTVNTAPFGAFLWKFQVNFSLLLYHRLSSSHRLWRTLFSFNSAFLSDGYSVLNLSFHQTAFVACFWPLFASVGLIKLISNSSRQKRFLKSFARYAQRFSNRTLRLCWSLILPGYVTKINQISLNCGLLLTSSCRVHALKCLREIVIVFSTRQLIIELRAYLLLKKL